MKILRHINVIRRYSNLNLKGLFPPVTLPFSSDESLNTDHFKNNLSKYEKINFSGIVLYGTNGEHVMLSVKERIEILKFVRSIYNNALIVGVRNESTKETIDEAKLLGSLGADCFLIGPPIIFRNHITENDLLQHYTRIADEVNKPVIIYNMPGAFVTDMSADLVTKASKHENIIGFKDSGGDVVKMWKIAKATDRNNFEVLAGGAGFLLPTLLGGCSGGICALANVLGSELVNLHQLFTANQMKEAVELQSRLIQPNFLVTKKYGVPGLKYAMELLGYHGGKCRAPIGQLKKEGELDIQKCFQDNGFL